MTSCRRTNDPSPLEVEPSTAGATGGDDHASNQVAKQEDLSHQPRSQRWIKHFYGDHPSGSGLETAWYRIEEPCTNEPLEES